MATALVDMRGTTSPRLVLELACARVLLPGAASDTAALLARLDRLERRLSATGIVDEAIVETAVETAVVADMVAAEEAVAEVVAEPLAVVAESSVSEAPTSTGVLDIVALRRLWDGVLDAVKQRSRTAHALMFSSQIESLEGKTLTLSFPTPTLASRFANDVADFVVEALKEVVGVDLILRTTSSARPASDPPTEPPSDPATGGQPARLPTPPTTSSAAGSAEPDPDDVDEAGDADAPPPPDPADAALALLKQDLGAQVIGEIDHS
jgi:DNA polymerase-3 subunit gamma/tau